MSKRALIVVLCVVSAALAVSLGVLIAPHLGSTPAAAHADANVTSAADTKGDGLVTANLACGAINTAGEQARWQDEVYVHGVETGQLRPDTSPNSLLPFWEQRVRRAHELVAQAAAEDPRWTALQGLLLDSEKAVNDQFDLGGITVHDAVSRAIGDYPDRIVGVCRAAINELDRNAQKRGMTPESILGRGGATKLDVAAWSGVRSEIGAAN